MSAQALQEDQLLELLLQLKKTTPEQARSILNSQPQISYALMAVMVNINAVNMEVVQKTLATYGAIPGSQPQTTAPAAPASMPAAAPAVLAPAVPAIPQHVASQPLYRGGTPTYPPQLPHNVYPQPGYPAIPNPYNVPPPAQIPGFSAQTGASSSASSNRTDPRSAGCPPGGAEGAYHLLSHLSHMLTTPQTLIMRVISMTREEIYKLPYAERENIIKLRSTLGLPT
ncbi:hypothetical protein A0H81_11624 [Grifola frondosa]|uniref:Cleavage stimulation factor subunit 2 hinge domain-containing protein n=1 Tax=Grifola frondosa TaxID=5627 RepID=A0A1C7LV36_GRIFR|nr:hypothetical protein A0H81_11624 [Grifola frondosa]